MKGLKVVVRRIFEMFNIDTNDSEELPLNKLMNKITIYMFESMMIKGLEARCMTYLL